MSTLVAGESVENEFPEFIATYFQRCQARVPAIEAIAGKWTFEDLIPGFSDFDTRFIVRDGLTAHDWCAMSMQVARVHFELARERKEWARTLEHLPGVNLTWGELFDPANFYPEFLQWSFYDGPPAKLERLRTDLDAHPWGHQDEEFHWKKIALYYGRYDRSIDPPVNLGPYEERYPLHSRAMHYFAPPLHSAVCLMRRQTTPGKLAAFRAARELFPCPETIELLLQLIENRYCAPDWLREPGLTELDARLEGYLQSAVGILLMERGDFFAEAAPHFSNPPSAEELKAAVRAAGSTPAATSLFENLKFARLMQGRLWFYAQEIVWFDSRWLIRNELNRIRANFYEQPLRAYARLFFDADLTAEQCLDRLRGDVLTPEQIGACRTFAEIADPVCEAQQLKARAAAVAEIYEPFLTAMESVIASVRQCTAADVR
jgi:hypothetical protein